MALVSGLYNVAPGTGSKRFPIRGADGAVRQVVGISRADTRDFFQRVSDNAALGAEDRLAESRGKYARFEPPKVRINNRLKSIDPLNPPAGYLPEKLSFDLAGIAFAPVWGVFIGKRQVREGAKPDMERVIDMRLRKREHSVISLKFLGDKVVRSVPAQDVVPAGGGRSCKVLMAADVKPVMKAPDKWNRGTPGCCLVPPEPRFYTWPARVPVY